MGKSGRTQLLAEVGKSEERTLLAEVGLMGLPNRHMLQTTKEKEGGGHLVECCKARVQPEVIIWTQEPSRTEVWS